MDATNKLMSGLQRCAAVAKNIQDNPPNDPFTSSVVIAFALLAPAHWLPLLFPFLLLRAFGRSLPQVHVTDVAEDGPLPPSYPTSGKYYRVVYPSASDASGFRKADEDLILCKDEYLERRDQKMALAAAKKQARSLQRAASSTDPVHTEDEEHIVTDGVHVWALDDEEFARRQKGGLKSAVQGHELTEEEMAEVGIFESAEINARKMNKGARDVSFAASSLERFR